MNNYSVDDVHEKLLAKKPLLAYDEAKNLADYRRELKDKLVELMGDMPLAAENDGLHIISEQDCGSYTLKYFTFQSEDCVTVPCYLLVPKGIVGKVPAVVCLQGHSTGMHLSIGKAIFEIDESKIKTGDRDFALQVVRLGMVALVVEQRCFGERHTKHETSHDDRCNFSAMNALLVGRTMLGERVFDTMRAIDVLSHFAEVDTDKIACMGNSGGGTVTYYTAMLDSRIKIAMPSCSVCTYKSSIGRVPHCVCNYIPSAGKYFDMGDLAALIAPRRLVVVCGREDTIFPLYGVQESFNTIKSIYTAAGAADNCALVVGEGGHRFYAADSWPVFMSYAKGLGWGK